MPSTESLVRTIPSSWKILCRGKGLQNALERKTDYESQNLKAKELRNCLERNSEVTETIQPSLPPGLQRAPGPVGKAKVLHKEILLLYMEPSSGFIPSLPEPDCMGEVISMCLGSER